MSKYWIVLSKWSLIDSMATESISPFSFYSNRCYGSDLSRYLVGSERMNHLLLFSLEPEGNYAIEIDDSLIDKRLLAAADKSKKAFKYPRSIFFQKGKIRFRFANETALKSFLAETEIMLEVKCTKLYQDDFYISASGTCNSIVYCGDCLAMEDQCVSTKAEDRFNYLKGSIIGYARGQITAKSQIDIDVLASLTNLKNSFGGLHTRLMIDESYEPSMELSSSIDASEMLYYKAGHLKTNNFNMLRLLYDDLIKIAKQRYAVLQHSKGPQKGAELRDLEAQARMCEEKISLIELQSNIYQITKELEDIKFQEVANGKREGKTRKYFPKGSTERQRKDYLKSIIEDFKVNNREYAELVRRLKEIKDRMTAISMGTTEYDGALAPMFIKLSDTVGNIIESVSRTAIQSHLDFLRIEVGDKGELHIKDGGQYSAAEVEYYNCLLDTIFENPLKELRPVSEVDALNLLEVSCRKFVQQGKTYNTEEGKNIKNILVSYWRYKKHDPRGKITLPDNMIVISNVLSFFIKCGDFSQIERYVANKGIPNKELALMLWSGFVGYASLPRTMTDEVYADTAQYGSVQKLIMQIQEKVYR